MAWNTMQKEYCSVWELTQAGGVLPPSASAGDVCWVTNIFAALLKAANNHENALIIGLGVTNTF